MQAAQQTSVPSASKIFFRPRRLGHVNLVVSNVDRSMDFYTNVAGIEFSYFQPLSRAGFVSNGNTHHDIGMVESSGPLGHNRPPGLNHLAFELETEVDLVDGYRRAIEAGVQFSRTVDHDIAHSLYSKDPDGNQYEIYADVVRDWRAVRSGVVTKPKPKWTPGSTPPNPNRNYDPAPHLVRVQKAPLHPRRIVHATLVAERFEEVVDHYIEVVGLVPLVGDRKAAFVLLGGTCGERNLAVFRSGNGRTPGLHHVGFEVWSEADLDSSLAALRASGAGPELHLEHDLRRSILVRDPDGIRLQFFLDRGRPTREWAACDPDIALLLA